MEKIVNIDVVFVLFRYIVIMWMGYVLRDVVWGIWVINVLMVI